MQGVKQLLEAQGARAATTCIHQSKSVRGLLESCIEWIRKDRPSSDMSIMMIVGELGNPGLPRFCRPLHRSAQASSHWFYKALVLLISGTRNFYCYCL